MQQQREEQEGEKEEVVVEEEPTDAIIPSNNDGIDEEDGKGIWNRKKKVFIQTLEGQLVPLDIDEDEQVEEMKAKLDEADPFLSMRDTVVSFYNYLGQELTDGRKVLSYDMGERSTVRLVLGRYPTYADWLQHKTLVPRLWWVLLCGVLGSLFIAAVAQISFGLPFHLTKEVPVTGQTFAVLLIPALLGMQLGLLATILYIIEGAAGLPFFASQKGGLAVVLGPTGGYLVGFVAAAYVVGWLVEKKGWDRRLITAFFAMSLGNIVIYIVAIPFLSHFTGWNSVWENGFLPFIPGDLFKILLATLILPIGWKIRAHRFNRKYSPQDAMSFERTWKYCKDGCHHIIEGWKSLTRSH